MISIITTYRFECDWEHGCRDHLTIHGATSLVEAEDRARREDWTIAKANRGPAKGRDAARCPHHAYRPATPRTGRPPGKVA